MREKGRKGKEKMERKGKEKKERRKEERKDRGKGGESKERGSKD